MPQIRKYIKDNKIATITFTGLVNQSTEMTYIVENNKGKKKGFNSSREAHQFLLDNGYKRIKTMHPHLHGKRGENGEA